MMQGLTLRRGWHAKHIKLFVHHLEIFNSLVLNLHIFYIYKKLYTYKIEFFNIFLYIYSAI